MSNSEFYRTFEHTADLGIETWGIDLAEVFSNAAKALFSEMTRRSLPEPKVGPIDIKVEASDLEDLLVRWLSELLFLSETKKITFTRFVILNIEKINSEEKIKLEAKVWGVDFSEATPELAVKAITYHALKIEKTENGFLARFVADI